MDKPQDPEAQAQLEVVFDCCGLLRITYHKGLEQQIIDGLNNAVPSTKDPVHYKEFWLTSDGANNLIDTTYSWNPNLQAQFPNAVGDLTIFITQPQAGQPAH